MSGIVIPFFHFSLPSYLGLLPLLQVFLQFLILFIHFPIIFTHFFILFPPILTIFHGLSVAEEKLVERLYFCGEESDEIEDF